MLLCRRHEPLLLARGCDIDNGPLLFPYCFLSPLRVNQLCMYL